MEALKASAPFLYPKLARHDVLLIRIHSAPRPQFLGAAVERVYGPGNVIDSSRVGKDIEFVHAPGNWGSEPLKVGEQAIVFLTSMSGKLYEDAWHGHMSVEDIQGKRYAIFPHRELWLSENLSPSLRAYCCADPKRPYASAILFDAMEAYLLELVAKAGPRD